MATAEGLEARYAELREKFLEKYKESIDNGSYHPKDLKRLEADDAYMKCFLISAGDFDKAVDRIDESFKFRKSINLPDMTEDSLNPVVKENNPIYWHGKDKQGRKILLFKLVRHKSGTLVEEAKQYIAYKFEEHHSQFPGERIVIMYDYTDAGVSNMDLDVTRFLITCYSTYFPCLVGNIFMYEMPFLLNAIWAIIKGWLSKEQREKIVFVKKANIQERIDADQLEPHMVK